MKNYSMGLGYIVQLGLQAGKSPVEFKERIERAPFFVENLTKVNTNQYSAPLSDGATISISFGTGLVSVFIKLKDSEGNIIGTFRLFNKVMLISHELKNYYFGSQDVMIKELFSHYHRELASFVDPNVAMLSGKKADEYGYYVLADNGDSTTTGYNRAVLAAVPTVALTDLYNFNIEGHGMKVNCFLVSRIADSPSGTEDGTEYLYFPDSDTLVTKFVTNTAMVTTTTEEGKRKSMEINDYLLKPHIILGNKTLTSIILTLPATWESIKGQIIGFAAQKAFIELFDSLRNYANWLCRQHWAEGDIRNTHVAKLLLYKFGSELKDSYIFTESQIRHILTPQRKVSIVLPDYFAKFAKKDEGAINLNLDRYDQNTTLSAILRDFEGFRKCKFSFYSSDGKFYRLNGLMFYIGGHQAGLSLLANNTVADVISGSAMVVEHCGSLVSTKPFTWNDRKNMVYTVSTGIYKQPDEAVKLKSSTYWANMAPESKQRVNEAARLAEDEPIKSLEDAVEIYYAPGIGEKERKMLMAKYPAHWEEVKELLTTSTLEAEQLNKLKQKFDYFPELINNTQMTEEDGTVGVIPPSLPAYNWSKIVWPDTVKTVKMPSSKEKYATPEKLKAYWPNVTTIIVE